ncbi:MAG: Antibiotic biosynthesis monooxygenase [Syntrophorhabdus sp. PtaU1.Bin002]|nr:MAG: Antibiotic biosynthesis monooxygenase [Syntrophorhabdus sp. PtaB.Bin006]OPY71641.1 MAG: Antibiotic biosynthesis monooxygenase [Syntrophorhabdus sp. PtaU1.Bin002]
MKLTIEIRAQNGKFQELYQTLRAILPMIRNEKGCLDCHIYTGVEDEEVLFLSVHWKSRADLEHYMRSESGSALLGAIDLLSETAKVGFDRNSRWEGINTLKKMTKKT